MPIILPIRLAATAAALACATGLLAQSTMASHPSAIPPQPALPATPTTIAYQPPPIPAQLPPAPAQIGYNNGTLSVSADNASLNQVLRQISQQTGIKISGGVADERVFGHYGPAAPAQVLSALLDGTSCNMLFVQSTGAAPAELVLTTRNGGPTPPNPNAAVFRDQAEQRELSPPPDEPATPSEPTPNAPATAIAPAAAGSPDASQPDSPNGVRSPQQIYEQLQHMRQQQQQPQPQSQPQ